jgi:hypothetical protein
MSPHLHYEIARTRQHELAIRTIHAHHRHDVDASTGSRRPIDRRLGQAVVALGVCVAATTAVTMSGAHASPRPAKSGTRPSAAQVAREIGALEAKGYVQASCKLGGTLMLQSRTGRSVFVRW